MTRERQDAASAKTAKFHVEEQCLVAAPRKGRRPGYRSLRPLAGVRWTALVRRSFFSGASVSHRIKRRIAPLPLTDDEWLAAVRELELSPQQARIVSLILRGLKDKCIAAELRVSVATVRTHLGRIFARHKLDDRVALVLRVFATVRPVH